MHMFPRFLRTLATRVAIARSLFRFLAAYKLWWMIPLVAVLLVFFVLLIAGQASPLGPFIYALF